MANDAISTFLTHHSTFAGQSDVRYFNSLTETHSGYWSDRMLCISKDIKAELSKASWKDVIKLYFDRYDNAVKILKYPVSICFTTGNSHYTQYGYFDNNLGGLAATKLLDEHMNDIRAFTDGNDYKIERCYDHITITKPLGYGKKVASELDISFKLDIGSNYKRIVKGKARVYIDNGFLQDELTKLADKINAEINEFIKSREMKYDFTKHFGKINLADYTTEEQIGIIEDLRCRKFASEWFVDLYNEASEYEPSLPAVTFSQKKNKYHYEQVEFFNHRYTFKTLSDHFEVQSVWFSIENNMAYALFEKYNLIDTYNKWFPYRKLNRYPIDSTSIGW